ncbi:MAG: hypothetical protein IJ468_11435 [Lachnospiraceae bacterium]|nr:hypothetical protein [Lachnospiraceae bacterium]
MGEHVIWEYEKRISELENEVGVLREEKDRLLRENEILHETAWDLIRQLREQKGKGIESAVKKNMMENVKKD